MRAVLGLATVVSAGATVSVREADTFVVFGLLFGLTMFFAILYGHVNQAER